MAEDIQDDIKTSGGTKTVERALAIKEKSVLHAIYMPFLAGGGLYAC